LCCIAASRFDGGPKTATSAAKCGLWAVFYSRRGQSNRTEQQMTVKAKASEGTDAAAPAVTSGLEQTAVAFKEGVAKATAGFQTTQAQVKENVEKAMKTAEELLAFNQGNFEAVVKSGKIWSTGVQDITQQVVASAQASFDETLATYRALAAVKSLKEAVDLQTSLARSAMEKAVSETGRLTDASVKLAEQAMAPLTQRFALAMEKFARTA
jgi:phasin family protein